MTSTSYSNASDCYEVQWGYCGEHIQVYSYTVDGLFSALEFQVKKEKENEDARHPWPEVRLVNPGNSDPYNPSGLTEWENEIVEFYRAELA